MTVARPRAGRWSPAILLLVVSVAPAATPEPSAAQECLPHPVIRIEQNEGPLGFVLGWDPATGDPLYRPGSGVTSGTGTAEDPFVIEGWCIRTTATVVPPVPGIFIAHTDAHIAVRGNVVDGLVVSGGFGISLTAVRNAVVSGNTVRMQDWAGVRLRSSSGNVVARNTITANLLYGVMVDDGSTANVVRDNVITDTVMYGIYILNGAHANTVEHNVFERNQIGVRFFNAHNNLILRNRFASNHWGVFNSVVSSGNIVQENDITGSRYYGAENNVNQPLDARFNWWGCAGGPGAGGCDSVTGNVVVSPWLDLPNPGAGPR